MAAVTIEVSRDALHHTKPIVSEQIHINKGLDLPYEIIGCILRYLEPQALCATRATCKQLWSCIDVDQLLYKDYYQRTWDTPIHTREPTSNHWIEDVKRFTKLDLILSSKNDNVKRDNFEFVAKSIIDLISTAAADYKSKNLDILRQHFLRAQNRQAFMSDSYLFARARKEQPILRSSARKRELSAKLHCLHGKTILFSTIDSGALMYPWACSKVYDLRNYTSNTMWGPFKADGSGEVDWEMVEAIMMVLTYNLRQCHLFPHKFIRSIWDEAFGGIARSSYIVKDNLHQLPPPDALSEDPYGINGTWMRIVCFLDYTELFAYNFTAPPLPLGQPREPLQRSEAIRMIVMHIKISKVEQPGPDDGQELPIVHFRGNSRPRYAHWDPNAIAQVRGYVRMTKEGEVQWTTFSIYHGEERWRSEGVQVGGLRSARGVVGCWFDKDYDVHGPAGPTAFWKISDDLNYQDSDEEEDPDDDEDAEEEEDEDDDDDDDDEIEDDEDESADHEVEFLDLEDHLLALEGEGAGSDEQGEAISSQS